jgi:phosphatidylglycerol:prolipoprotein diacylglycerol transferase
MVNIYLDPVLLRWGPLTLSWHGLCLAAGLAILYVIAVRQGMRMGFPRESLSELALWLVVLGLAGARLLHVLQYWRLYMAAPLRILAVYEGGMTVNGAICGVIVGTILYARWKQLCLWKLADLLVIAAPLASIVGRVGCTISGDVWGLPTHRSWGLVYWHENASLPPDLLGVPTWPAPVMLQAWNLGLFLLLLGLRSRVPGDGFLFATYLVVYALGRFVVNTWQAGEVAVLGLKFFQVVALGFVLLGLAVMLALRSGREPVPADRMGQASP